MEWCFAAALPADLAVRRPRNCLGSPSLPAAERGNRPPAAVFFGPSRRRRVYSAVRQGQKRADKTAGLSDTDAFLLVNIGLNMGVQLHTMSIKLL